MNPETRLKLNTLHLCGFRPGSWEKRFVRDMYPLGPYDLLSPRHIQAIDSLYWHYRKQVNVIRAGNPTSYPVPTQPEVDTLTDELHHTSCEIVRKEIEITDKKAAAAMEKLAKWNRKVKGQ